MEMKITKENIDEHITSFIDNQENDPRTREEISKMVQADEMLAKKHRSELLTKNLLRTRLKLIEVPQETYLRVTSSIDALILSTGASIESPESDSFLIYLRNFFLAPLTVASLRIPRYAVAVVVIASVLLMGVIVSRESSHNPVNPYIASGSDKSILVQAVNNFHRVLSGEIKPQMESNDSREVSGYLKKKVNFDPVVPDLSEFELLGCVCDKFDGENLAHLVYASGDNVIYIYQTDISSVRQNKLELPDPVHQKVLSEKFYMCDHVDEADCTLLLWYFNDVICVSVSNLPKQNLYNKLTSIK